MLLASALLASTAQAQQRLTRRPSTQSQLLAFIDSAAANAIRNHDAPALGVAVWRGSRLLLDEAYGVSDLENQVRASPSTEFLIGSITKQFTAAAILQLVERGKLSLDDPLTKFFPEWPMPGERVTVRELLNHTSGIKDYTAPARFWSVDARITQPHDSILARVRTEPFDFPPGTAFRYSNTGYYLLGVILERVSGESYADYLQRHVFAPAGLSSTVYCDNDRIVPHRARGYVADGHAGFRNAPFIDMSTPFAAGALCATAKDLVVWTRALESGRVVQPNSYRQMTAPVPLPDGKPQSYGFGLAVGDLDGHRVVSHNGGINGFRAQLASYPNDSVIVAVVTNSETGLPDQLEKQIARRALGIPEPNVVDLPVPSADAARWAAATHWARRRST